MPTPKPSVKASLWLGARSGAALPRAVLILSRKLLGLFARPLRGRNYFGTAWFVLHCTELQGGQPERGSDGARELAGGRKG